MPRAVVVNGRCLHRPITGVERYTSELLARLAGRMTVLAPARPADGLRGHAWEQARLPALVGREALLWSPANAGPLAVSRQVVTLHDVSVLDHPEWFHPSFAAWYGFLLPRLARRVRRIVTDSHFSKGRIVERLGVPEARVTAIPCGVSARFAPAGAADTSAVRARYQLRHRFVMTVGSLQPRKNLPALLRAWATVRRRIPEAELIVVGTERANFRGPDLDRVPPGVRLLGFVPDEDLPALYSAADVAVVPSLYEGFGLPVLEAMACGTPVLVGSGTALDEVAGAAASTADMTSIESMSSSLEQLLQDASLRASLRARGLAHARHYTWERTAELTWLALQEAADD